MSRVTKPLKGHHVTMSILRAKAHLPGCAYPNLVDGEVNAIDE